MQGKKGTPTMGGLFVLGAVVISTLLLADVRNFHVQMALICVLWLGAVGMIDDWLKLTVGRRNGNRQGLTSLEKILLQIGLGVVLSYFTFEHGHKSKTPHTLFFPFFKNLMILPQARSFVILGTIVL